VDVRRGSKELVPVLLVKSISARSREMSRPKKNVLLVCSDEIKLSDLVIKLKVWGYSVEGKCVADALDCVRGQAFDLVLLVSLPLPRTWNLFTDTALDIQEIQAHRHSDTRVLDVFRTLPVEVAMGVPRILPSSSNWEYLRTAIRLSVGRKRGPKAPVPEMYLPVRSVA
jgi:hypothetical protein